MPLTAEIVDATLAHTAFALADKAETGSPDSRDSDGAKFLLRVQDSANYYDADALLEGIRDYVVSVGDAEDFGVNDLPDSIRDDIGELADSDVQIYTYALWREFTDLALWQEDVQGELGYPEDGDLTKIAMLAEYLVANRLLGVLLAERAQALFAANPVEDDEDDEEGSLNAWPAHDTEPCSRDGEHHVSQRHPLVECPTYSEPEE